MQQRFVESIRSTLSFDTDRWHARRWLASLQGSRSLHFVIHHEAGSISENAGLPYHWAAAIGLPGRVAMSEFSGTGMSCNDVHTRTLEDILFALAPKGLAPHFSTMASSFATTGSGPTTLTLMPFHTDPDTRHSQQQRLPRVTQQPSRPISSPHLRPARSPAFTSTMPSSTQAPSARSVYGTSVGSTGKTRPTVVDNRNVYSPPRVAAPNNSSNAMTVQTRAPTNTHTSRHTVATVAKVHAIAPIKAVSIDSVLHGESEASRKTNAVPDRIRPKAEAIK